MAVFHGRAFMPTGVSFSRCHHRTAVLITEARDHKKTVVSGVLRMYELCFLSLYHA